MTHLLPGDTPGPLWVQTPPNKLRRKSPLFPSYFYGTCQSPLVMAALAGFIYLCQDMVLLFCRTATWATPFVGA